MALREQQGLNGGSDDKSGSEIPPMVRLALGLPNAFVTEGLTDCLACQLRKAEEEVRCLSTDVQELSHNFVQRRTTNWPIRGVEKGKWQSCSST